MTYMDTNKLDGALKELEIKEGSAWKSVKKAHEVHKALKGRSPENAMPMQSHDNLNLMMFQALPQMEHRMQQQGDCMTQDLVENQGAAIAVEATNSETKIVIQRRSKEMCTTRHFFKGRNPGISMSSVTT